MLPVTYPKVTTSNGLTKAICNYCLYMNAIGNRINVSGRLVDGVQKTESGLLLTTKKWMSSTTQKGTADITVQLPNGRVIFIEVKVGRDIPRPAQLAMQDRVRKANGVYEFVGDMDRFMELFDQYGTCKDLLPF